jgi:hypothetical protein
VNLTANLLSQVKKYGWQIDMVILINSGFFHNKLFPSDNIKSPQIDTHYSKVKK